MISLTTAGFYGRTTPSTTPPLQHSKRLVSGPSVCFGTNNDSQTIRVIKCFFSLLLEGLTAIGDLLPKNPLTGWYAEKDKDNS